jgi:hypothetical protein
MVYHEQYRDFHNQGKVMHRIVVILSIVALLGACTCAPATIPTDYPAKTISPVKTRTVTRSPAPTRTATPTPSTRPTFTPVPAERPEYDNISGTYKVVRSDGGWCIIKIILEQHAPEDVIGFELFCIRGAPSYNSGSALGRLLSGHNMAVFSPNQKCSIVLIFKPNSIDVTQIGMDFDCGFGHTVYADGIYQLIDDRPPVIGCMRGDNPCNLPVPIP